MINKQFLPIFFFGIGSKMKWEEEEEEIIYTREKYTERRTPSSLSIHYISYSLSQMKKKTTATNNNNNYCLCLSALIFCFDFFLSDTQTLTHSITHTHHHQFEVMKKKKSFARLCVFLNSIGVSSHIKSYLYTIQITNFPPTI